jgi:hypothetical protein
MIPDPVAHWQIDRRIPVAFLIGLLVQTFLAGWYISSLDQRLTNLEAQNQAAAPQGHRLVILETKLENMSDILREIRTDLRRVSSAPHREPSSPIRVHPSR